MERIAVVVGKLHSGGKKSLVMEYYRNIDRNEIQFDFICDSDSNSIPYDEIEQLGGRVFVVAPYENIILNMLQMKKIFKDNKYRILHSYNGTMNLFSLFVGFCSGIPIRISESISMAHDADWKTVLKKILKPCSKMFATHFAANGEMCGRWQFGDKIFDAGKVNVFRTVVNTKNNDFDPVLRNNTRKELKIENEIVIGHIGRLTEQKNTLFIVEIFNEIVKLDSKAKLLIVGDGNLKEEMLKRIDEYNLNENVLYLGRREDIHQFYNAMDCFLLPSLYEGLPVVGVEAETSGLPVFFSSEIPEESSACPDLGCFLNLTLSAKVWATTILDKVNNERNRRNSRVLEVVEAGFDSKVEAQRLQEFYMNLLNV